MSELKELIGVYWDIAYHEGSIGVDHDTKTGAAQQTWSAIEKEIERQQAIFLAANAEIQLLSETIVGQQAEIERLTKALRRLSSMEAFYISRTVDKKRDDELLARIEYAEKALNHD